MIPHLFVLSVLLICYLENVTIYVGDELQSDILFVHRIFTWHSTWLPWKAMCQ